MLILEVLWYFQEIWPAILNAMFIESLIAEENVKKKNQRMWL